MNTSSAVSKPLSNKLVRQAVSHAVNYAELLKLANGHAKKPPTTIPLGLLAADTVQPPAYDVTLAKQLMAQAGYANGFELKFVYPQVVKFSVDYGLIATKLQADLGQIGIKLTLQPVTQAQFLAAYRAKTDPFGISFDSADYPDPDDFVGPFWSSQVNFFTKRTNYQNAQIDQLFPQSLSTTGDARVQVYKQLQGMFLDDPVYFGLMVPDYILAYRNRVHGYAYTWDLRQVDFSKISLS
jgi:ABC-type transport system substrate-binding protein